MSIPGLQLVREDTSIRVFAGWHDRIHPQQLSESLCTEYGKDRFQISLRRNVYLIYVQRETTGEKTVCKPYHLLR